MYFSEIDPKDFPAPSTLAEAVAEFRVPVMSFVSQPAVSVRSISTTRSSMNAEPSLLTSVSLSYTFWRVPGDHSDPANLAEAVMTTHPSDDGWQNPESTLVDHVNYVLLNTFREQRTVGGFPGELDSPATKEHIEPTSVRVDGGDLSGMRLDTDPNVYGVGVALRDRILTAVIARDHLPDITMAFETLASRPPAA